MIWRIEHLRKSAYYRDAAGLNGRGLSRKPCPAPMSGLGARTARDARWRPSQPIREVLRASASADTRDRQQPKRSPDLAAAVGCRRPASAAGYRTTPHGGLRCQEGVLTCPGDVEIAGPGVVLASSQLPCSMPSRGPGSAPAAGERPSGRRARTNELEAGKRRHMIGSEEGRPAAAGCQGCVGSAEWVSHPPIRRLPGGAGRHDRAIRGRAAQSVLRARRGRLRLICELARGPATPPAVTCAVYCVPGSDATSIAESEEVSPRFPDRSADARSAGHVLGPGVLATGKRLAALAVRAGSSPSASSRPTGPRAWRLTLPRRATSGC